MLAFRTQGGVETKAFGNVQSVDDSRNVTQDGEQDVDEQVGTASALEEDTQRGQEDGKDDLADVAVGSIVSIGSGRE